MPSIVYVHPPHSPVRRMPKSVQMNTVEPSPWACRGCRTRAVTYADGVVWCNKCEKKLLDGHKIDVTRGEQRNTPTPAWVPIKT